MREIMIYKQNNLTGDWLCWIPFTGQAYYCHSKKAANEFCDRVNKAFAVGDLEINKGKVIMKKI